MFRVVNQQIDSVIQPLRPRISWLLIPGPPVIQAWRKSKSGYDELESILADLVVMRKIPQRWDFGSVVILSVPKIF
jgi:hypothetical protein